MIVDPPPQIVNDRLTDLAGEEKESSFGDVFE
jgi:hypothetical protein